MAFNLNLENKKQIATIVIAIALGVVAAFLIGQYVQNSVNEQTKILAQEYQKKNSELRNQMDGMKSALDRVASQQAALAQQQDQIRQMKSTSAPQNQVPQSGASFSLRTPPGKRAVTINIDSLSAVGGLINPGDYVDIVGQLNVPNDQGAQEVISVLFQSIQVLAIGSNFNSATSSVQVYDAQQRAGSLYVTLALDPEEAGLLIFARNKGKLQLSLRSPQEKGIKNVQVASWGALSDFVLQKQGTELSVPKPKVVEGSKKTDAIKLDIQVFKSGQESKLEANLEPKL